uniref:Uncharacterized protein n=1 Tax=Meleagris gallopavo TaxID=9103 RepID=A0A803XNR2_MELGA
FTKLSYLGIISTCYSFTVPLIIFLVILYGIFLFYLDNISMMDPIQKAVINHTFGVPLPHRRKQIISCNICQLRFNSDVSQSFCIRLEICTYLLGCVIICIN